MNTCRHSNINMSLQDKVILLGFLALTAVEVVHCRPTAHSSSSHFYFSPHELPNVDADHGVKKLHQYRHRRWGSDSASHSKKVKRQTPKQSLSGLQDELLVMLHQQIRGGAVESQDDSFNNDILGWRQQLDYSDNPDQVRVLKHHYLNEFGHHISLSEVLKDYSENCTIHLVVDNQPQTFHGRDGARQAFLQLFNLVPHDLSHHIEFEHIAIDHNHAQVVWKAEIPSQDKIIRGMDSFAFDQDNRIVHQSIMALSVPMNKDNNDYDAEMNDDDDSNIATDRF